MLYIPIVITIALIVAELLTTDGPPLFFPEDEKRKNDLHRVSV